MCMTGSTIKGLNRYHWEGDEIIHHCVVPSSRPVPNYSNRYTYDIDVREFLVSERNEKMGEVLRTDIKKFIALQKGNWGLFQSRGEQSFDYRAAMIAAFVGKKIRYTTVRAGKPWLFPDETLSVQEGDCEDRACLMASLMLASGISSYNVRVVLGKVRVSQSDHHADVFDHVWVMYKNESGTWNLFEPMQRAVSRRAVAASTRRRAAAAATTEYIPYFAFNDTHLWRIGHAEHDQTFEETVRKTWKRFDPTFAGEVHKTVLNRALNGVAPQWMIDTLNRNFYRIAWVSPIVDDVDNFIKNGYDPLDHFDNGYITDGWKRVRERLATFKQSNQRNLNSFAFAAHAIADFYAHSSYIHFAPIRNPEAGDAAAKPCDSQNPARGLKTDYGPGSTFDLSSSEFSVNVKYWTRSKAEIPAVWKGKIISGRYAQLDDSKGLFDMQRLIYIPDKLQNAADFWKRGSLPHHNEIAVDEEAIGSDHKLYSNAAAGKAERMNFQNQLRWRMNTAVAHIRQAYLDNKES